MGNIMGQAYVNFHLCGWGVLAHFVRTGADPVGVTPPPIITRDNCCHTCLQRQPASQLYEGHSLHYLYDLMSYWFQFNKVYQLQFLLRQIIEKFEQFELFSICILTEAIAMQIDFTLITLSLNLEKYFSCSIFLIQYLISFLI